jgi:uracil-DNA glycosylase
VILQSEVEGMARQASETPAVAEDNEAALSRLKQKAEAKTCPRGSKPVFGRGSHSARLVIVGEAPGETEEREGQPFVGRAGKLLQKTLEGLGVSRSEVWITNVVKCRPTTEKDGRTLNRRPSRTEIDEWKPLLLEELAILRPRVVLCLGGVAAGALLGKDERLVDLRGHFYPREDASVVGVTYHPSFLLQRYASNRDKELAEFRHDLAAAIETAGIEPEDSGTEAEQ